MTPSNSVFIALKRKARSYMTQEKVLSTERPVVTSSYQRKEESSQLISYYPSFISITIQ